jgi:hypothetical protein
MLAILMEILFMIAILMEGSASKLKCLVNDFRCPEPANVLQATGPADISSNIAMSCNFQYYDHCVDSHNVHTHTSFSQGFSIYAHPTIYFYPCKFWLADNNLYSIC